MLIEAYELRVESPPCDPGSARCSAFAQLGVDISTALPYLNARLDGAIYDHAAGVLTWRMGSRAVSIRPYEIAISGMEDRTEAQLVMQEMMDLVNRIWEERDSIAPSLVKRQRLQAVAVYRLLPRQNCQVCGSPTCFAFALQLATGQARLDQCPPLLLAEHASSRDCLLQMLAAAGVVPAVTGGRQP